MKPNIDRLPWIEFTMPDEDRGETWVEFTFILRYQLRTYYEFGRECYEAEILDADLIRATAWSGDSGAPIPAWPDHFEADAEARFWKWEGYYFRTSSGVDCWPNRDLVHEKCYEDSLGRAEEARELAAEAKLGR